LRLHFIPTWHTESYDCDQAFIGLYLTTFRKRLKVSGFSVQVLAIKKYQMTKHKHQQFIASGNRQR